MCTCRHTGCWEDCIGMGSLGKRNLSWLEMKRKRRIREQVIDKEMTKRTRLKRNRRREFWSSMTRKDSKHWRRKATSTCPLSSRKSSLIHCSNKLLRSLMRWVRDVYWVVDSTLLLTYSCNWTLKCLTILIKVNCNQKSQHKSQTTLKVSTLTSLLKYQLKQFQKNLRWCHMTWNSMSKLKKDSSVNSWLLPPSINQLNSLLSCNINQQTKLKKKKKRNKSRYSVKVWLQISTNISTAV